MNLFVTQLTASFGRTAAGRRLGMIMTLVMLLMGVGNVGWGQLFQQNFSSSTTVSDYVNATPNNGQFSAIGTSGGGTVLSINTTGGNKLRFARSGTNAGSFSRTTDFSPIPTSIMYRFDLTVSGNSLAQTFAAVWQVGSAFGTANGAESNTNTHSRIGLNWTNTAGQFSLRNVDASTNTANYTGTQTITWVINNSGGTLSYRSPSGVLETVANDRYDLWIGTTKEFDDQTVTTSTQTLTDLKFVVNQGTGTVDIDNILIDPIPAIPTSNTPINIASNGFRARWNAVTGVTGYRVDVSTASDFSSFVAGYNNLYVAGQATDFLDVTGLNPNTPYYYRVRAASQYTVGEFASGNSASQNPTTTSGGGTPTQLVITSITPSTPTQGSTFDVTVQAQDNSNVPQNVTTATGISLTTNGNAGTIGGTTIGTINAGASSVTITGVTLSGNGTGVTLTATQTSGTPSLTAGTSAAFTVVAAAPTIVSSGMNFGTRTVNSIVLTSWTPGNGANRIVVARPNATARVAPTNGTAYTVGNTTGTGNTVIYVGNGSGPVTASSLASPATLYAFDVYEYNGSSTTISYGGVFTATASTLAAEPTAQGAITVGTITSGSIALSGYDGGNGSAVMLVAKAGGPVDAVPVDGQNYAGSLTFGSGTDLGGGNFVITTGTTTSAIVAGLSSSTTYHFAVFDYNGTLGTTANFLTTSPGTANATTLAGAPSTLSSAMVFGTRTVNSIVLSSWTPGNGANRIVVARTNATSRVAPSNGTSYVVGNTTGSGNTVIYVGNGSGPVTASSLASAGTLYAFDIYEFNGTGASTTYGSNFSPTAYTLANEPTAHSSTFSVASYGATSITFNVQALSGITNGGGYNILYRTGSSAPATIPADGAAFATSGDAILGANTTTTSATTLQVTGLTPGQTYSFALYPYGIGSSNDATRNYRTAATVPTVLSVTLPNANTDVVTANGEQSSISSMVNDAVVNSTSTGVEVWRFSIRDGGLSAADGDGLPTKVSAITIARGAGSSINFADVIQSVGLFTNTGAFIANASSITATQIVFSGLTLEVPNNTVRTYHLRISIRTNTGTEQLTLDGKDFQFSISGSNVTVVNDGTGSQLASFSAAQSVNDQNIVAVVASTLAFVQQPSTVAPGAQMSPAVTVSANDANGNRDLGYTTAVSITSTGALQGSPVSSIPVSGLATFSTLTHLVINTGRTLTATSGSFTSPLSSPFNIQNLPVPLAGWDFDPLTGGTGNFGASPLNATTTNTNVTIGGLTRGSGVAQIGAGAANAWGGNGWDGNATLASAITANDFVTFTITANTGYSLSLDNISAYNIRRSTNGPTTGQWQYRIGSGSYVDIGAPITWGTTTTAAGNAQPSINLSGVSALQNVPAGTTVTFRIVNWNAIDNTGSWYLNDPVGAPGNDFVVNGFALSTTNTWVGGPTGNWNEAGNWTLGIPVTNQDILIDNGTPTLNTDYTHGSGFNFNINGTGGLIVDAARTLTLQGTANFGSRPVTLRSTAAGTAAIGNITGSLSGATNVTVERYIPAARKWRMLTAPVTGGTNNSIFYNWQNDGNATGSTGAIIWSNTGGNGLYNAGGTTNTSILRLTTPGGNSWTPLNGTTNNNLFTASQNNSYMIFVTGPFNTGGNYITGTPAPTTLRATGTLRQGAVTFGSLPTGFNMVGNPYASPVRLSQLAAGLSAEVAQFFYIWNPNQAGLGGYTTAIAGSTNLVIQSGQAFLVNVTGSTGSVQFQESYKGSTGTPIGFRPTANDTQLTINLRRFVNGSPALYDIALAQFKTGANPGVDNNDAVKAFNFGENMSLLRSGVDLAIERRPLITANDTLFLRMWNMAQANYQLELLPENLQLPTGFTAVLQDQFLATEQVLSTTSNSTVNFTVTSNAASAGNRFRIVFRTNTPTSVRDINTLKGISVYPNPVVKGNDLQLQFRNVAAGRYEVMVYGITGTQVMQRTIMHGGGNGVQRVVLPGELASGTYVVELTAQNGQKQQLKITIQ